MSTRRRIPSGPDEPPAPAAKDAGPAPPSATASTAPTVPASVIAKLSLFTLAMIAAPLGSYYLAVSTVFKGQNTIAGAIAAVVANVVLICYVIVAIREDDSDAATEKKSQ